MYTCCLLPKKKKSKNPYPSQMEASLWRMPPGQGCCGGLGLGGVGARFGRQRDLALPVSRQDSGSVMSRGEAGLRGYLCVKGCQGWKDENLLCSPRAPNFLPSRQLAGFL